MDICASTHWITLRVSVFLPLSHIPAYTYALRCVYVCVCMDAQTLAWNKVQNENGIVMSLQQQLGWWVRKPWKISPTCYVTFTIFFFFLVPRHLLGLSTLGSIPDLWPGHVTRPYLISALLLFGEVVTADTERMALQEHPQVLTDTESQTHVNMW